MDTRELLARIATYLAYDLECGDGHVTRAFIELADAVEARENAVGEFIADLACSQVDMATDLVLSAIQVEPKLMESQV